MTGKIYSYPWHNDTCERSQERVDSDGHKRFFCVTHGQWASEIPIKTVVTHTYGDGATHEIVTEWKQP